MRDAAIVVPPDREPERVFGNDDPDDQFTDFQPCDLTAGIALKHGPQAA